MPMPCVANSSYRSIVVALCLAMLAGGCSLQRIGGNPGYRVEPMEYCPGDTLTASYDYLGDLVPWSCPDGVGCSAEYPQVRITTSPELPSDMPESMTGYTGSREFATSGDRIQVNFDVTSPRGEDIWIPTNEFDDRGRRVVLMRRVSDLSRTATLLGAKTSELMHEGMCNGAMPVNAEAALPGPPDLSPNAQVTSLCNTSSVPIIASLLKEDGAALFIQMVSPGNCLRAGEGSVPSDLAGARRVRVEPLSPDPMTRCGAASTRPPPPLRTRVVQQCR